jgi:hypothetical protein
MAIFTVVSAITWDTTAQKAQAALDDFCAYHGYQATLGDGEPNPETKTQFKQRMVIKFFKESIKAQRAIAAAETARQSAIDLVESDMVLT